MIQILGIREFTDKNTGEPRLYDAFHEKNWRVPDIFDLFANLDAYMGMIPEDMRWNLFYTVANCTDEKRVFLSQDVIPLDIDGIDAGTEGKVVAAVCTELKLNPKEVGITYSGNGIHILIGLATPLTANYIEEHKHYYRALCGRVNLALFESGIAGKADTTVFSKARILRLPNTKNIKKDKATKQATLVNGTIKKLNVTLIELSDIPEVQKGEHIHPRALIRMPDPDRVAIEKECSFIARCKEQPESVSEPEWYAMLSIVGRFKDGDNLVHEYSKGHSGYSEARTDMKLQHALEASGPRTCENISQFNEGCRTCPHFRRITSPIQIVGESTIRTKETGFYEIIVDKNGNTRVGKPSYDDLERWFKTNYDYVTIEEGQTTMVYNSTFWEEIPSLRVHKFAEDNFNPSPTTSMCLEFENKLKRMHPVSVKEFTVSDMLNFKNGVLKLDTGTLVPHSRDYKFTYCIPYAYEPKGDCPTFKKFIKDVSCNDPEIEKLLVEYVGYCISSTSPELIQKCALLHGEGSNGKSVLLSLMREMVGAQNCAAIGLDSLRKESHRYQLMNKLFNACAETPTNAFLDSEIFKSMVSGDDIEVRRLYGDPMMWKCTTKLMFACNDLPFNGDFSHGLYRRLIIIPFNNIFSHEKGNLDPTILGKLLEERSDIFKYCLDQFKDTIARGYKFPESLKVKEELEDYREMGDVVGRFVLTMCETDASATNELISLESVFKLFVLWCKENEQGTISYGSFSRRFGRVLQRVLPKVEKARPRVNENTGGRGTAYKNLRILASTSF